MEDTIKALADDIYRRKVLRAKNAPASKKTGWGGELFDEACERMRMGIRHQFPDADADEVEVILLQRLKRLRQVHEHGIYRECDPK